MPACRSDGRALGSRPRDRRRPLISRGFMRFPTGTSVAAGPAHTEKRTMNAKTMMGAAAIGVMTAMTADASAQSFSDLKKIPGVPEAVGSEAINFTVVAKDKKTTELVPGETYQLKNVITGSTLSY